MLASNQITVLNAYGSLFFAGARNLEEDLPQVEETRNAVVILSLRGHTELGSTFIGVLERYAQALHVHGNTLMLVERQPGGLRTVGGNRVPGSCWAPSMCSSPASRASRPCRPIRKRRRLIQAATAQPEEIDKPL